MVKKSNLQKHKNKKSVQKKTALDELCGFIKDGKPTDSASIDDDIYFEGFKKLRLPTSF